MFVTKLENKMKSFKSQHIVAYKKCAFSLIFKIMSGVQICFVLIDCVIDFSLGSWPDYITPIEWVSILTYDKCIIKSQTTVKWNTLSPICFFFIPFSKTKSQSSMTLEVNRENSKCHKIRDREKSG